MAAAIVEDQTSVQDKLLLGGVYVLLSTSSIICVRLSQTDSSYKFNPVSVTLFTELLKFLVSVTMAVLVSRARPVYRRMDLDSGEMKDDGGDGEHRHGSEQSQQRSPLSLKYHIRYMFPGLCYFATNNIYFFVLGIFDPAVAQILLNFNIITTAVLFRIVLQRPLNRIQWASLVCLTCGIITLSPQATGSAIDMHSGSSFSALTFGYILVLSQCLCGSFGNIYSEKIMKQEYQTSIHVQNAWIYAFGVFFNGISLALYSWRGGEWHGLLHGYTGLTWTVVLLNTVLGLTIALILKHVDNIFHLFAHQVTAVSVLVCSIVLFDFQLSIAFLCGATIVACSIYTFTLAKHMAFQQAE